MAHYLVATTVTIQYFYTLHQK